ncbi:histidine kinase [Shewanella sp. Choline-02u-19]|jgi:signal transduction histidine kinase|uniref:sensor histidine kinase n=1 Tax=unclassified Shewanella TaxID=196818 RepID=UPI000C3261D5|nr:MULTISPECIES: HAMP domain-containing sensor histidine kinase [unclassified Shewanella]PKG59284.1 histidine kinase [Shewanella sp. GutDb-MelDb]PKG75474.1 histidine kinase [Shewanella sp. GutCb]PKH56105.1 histidine kinase [Shewanella sp. Bg11-22]PKI27260.1 histidine kinase [Shewanella sp. Choline-02u-19]
MSIKRYVFLLFGALILMLAISQLFVAQYFKTQLQQELQQSSKSLSKSLVSVVIQRASDIDRWEFSLPEENEFLTDIEENKEFVLELDEDIAELEQEIDNLAQSLVEVHVDTGTNDYQKHQLALQEKVQALLEKDRRHMEGERENLQQLKREAAKEYQQRVEESLESFEIHTDDWLQAGRVMIVDGDEKDGMVIREERSIDLPSQGANHLLERFSESVLIVILLTSIMALILAYWLSHHVTEPLSELALGHQKLGEGKFGIQLKEQGVKELKQIMNGFNRMSLALENWNKKEQQMSQQQHLADLGQITRGIAHSLRNPLHTLGLLSEQGIYTDSQSEREAINQKMQKKIGLMDKSIQSLLTLSSHEVLRDKLVPLNAIVQDILLELSISGLKPDVIFDANNLVAVYGAESELRSIVHAVLINAVEAGGKQIKIELNKAENEKSVVITDWGKGIEPSIKSQMFKPHITTKSEGSGMGIYIAKRLIESHYNGDICYQDNPEGGTIATILFVEEQSSQKEDN